MKYYDVIFDAAVGNFGLVTSSEARELGIPGIELVKLAARGRLRRLGYGVYKLVQYAPAPDGLDAYADVLAIVGREAYLYGPSVLALLKLCPTNPGKIYAGTPRRCRKRLGGGVVLYDNTPCRKLEWYEGIPAQSADVAIRSSVGNVMPERLAEAVTESVRRGLFPAAEARKIRSEVLR